MNSSLKISNVQVVLRLSSLAAVELLAALKPGDAATQSWTARMHPTNLVAVSFALNHVRAVVGGI